MCRCLLLHVIPGSLDSHFRKRSLFLCKVETWSDIHRLDTWIQLMWDKSNVHLHPLIYWYKSSQIPWPVSVVFDLFQRYFFKHPRNLWVQWGVFKHSRCYMELFIDAFWSPCLNISLNAAIKILSAREPARKRHCYNNILNYL